MDLDPKAFETEAKMQVTLQTLKTEKNNGNLRTNRMDMYIKKMASGSQKKGVSILFQSGTIFSLMKGISCEQRFT